LGKFSIRYMFTMSLETSMCTVSATICILSLRILQQINVVLGLTFSAAVSAAAACCNCANANIVLLFFYME